MSTSWQTRTRIPVLEPNLNRTLRHVDLVSNALSHICGRGGVLVELHLERCQLILCGSLSFLVLLLLGQGALPWRALGGRAGVVASRRGRGGCLDAARVTARHGGSCVYRRVSVVGVGDGNSTA